MTTKELFKQSDPKLKWLFYFQLVTFLICIPVNPTTLFCNISILIYTLHTMYTDIIIRRLEIENKRLIETICDKEVPGLTSGDDDDDFKPGRNYLCS